MDAIRIFLNPLTRSNPTTSSTNRQTSPIQFGTSTADTVNLTQKNQKLRKDLLDAIYTKSLEEVQAAVNALPADPIERAKIINQRIDSSRNTLLHRAVLSETRSLPIVKYLLENGAQESIDKPGQNSWTPIQLLEYDLTFPNGLALRSEAPRPPEEPRPPERPMNVFQWLKLPFSIGTYVRQLEILYPREIDRYHRERELHLERYHREVIVVPVANITASSFDLAGLLLAYGCEEDNIPVSESFDNTLYAHLKTNFGRHTKTLVNPKATPEQVKEAVQWLQQFPPGGGALLWNVFEKSTIQKLNQFILTKTKELQNASDEVKQQILDRVQPLLHIGFHLNLNEDLLETARVLKREDWLADAVQIDPSFTTTQKFLQHFSPIFNKLESAAKRTFEFTANTEVDNASEDLKK